MNQYESIWTIKFTHWSYSLNRHLGFSISCRTRNGEANKRHSSSSQVVFFFFKQCAVVSSFSLFLVRNDAHMC